MTVATRAPLYARVLRLRHLRPSGLTCFGLFEGTIGLAVLLALAEVTSWWAVVVLPLAVAAMVKLNDVLSGLIRPAGATAPAGQGAASRGARHRLLGSAPAREEVAGEVAPGGAAADRAALSDDETATEKVSGAGVSAFVPLRPAARAVRQVSRDVADLVDADPVDADPVDADPVDPVDSPQQRFRQSAQRRYR